MVYDRYGTFVFGPKSTTAGSTEIAGPVPDTLYKDKGSKLIQEGDELVLTPEALAWYQEAYDKREEVRDEVRASNGETELSWTVPKSDLGRCSERGQVIAAVVCS